MKRQKACAFFALLIAGWLQVNAQSAPPLNEPDYNKPKIFADLPGKMILRLADAEALLNLSVGAQVNATVGTGFILSGTVMSKSLAADETVQSVVIKSMARGGATFLFTRLKNADGSFLYRGGMLSRSAGDGLEIVKEGTSYILRKKGYYDLINE